MKRIPANESTDRDERRRTENMGPRWREIVGFNFGTLIRVSDGISRRVQKVETVEGIGRLEPRSRVAQIELNAVGLRWLQVDAIKNVLFVSLVVKDLELRSVQKFAGV